MSQNSEFFIDWISCVLPFSFMERSGGNIPTVPDIVRVAHRLGLRGSWNICKPRFGYEIAFRHAETGVVVQTTRRRENMGVNLVATGDPLRAAGWSDILAACCAEGGRFTRIDLSVDVHDEDFFLDSLSRRAIAGECITRTKKATSVVGSSGETLYIGSRSSQKFLRIYDKGAEQGEERGSWFRIELECKGMAANFAAYLVNDRSLNDFREAIMGFFDCPDHPGWTRAMEGVTEARSMKSDKKRADTETWLMEFVAGQVAKAEERDPGFLYRFYDAVAAILLA